MFAFALKDFLVFGKAAWFLIGIVFTLFFYPTMPFFGLIISMLPAWNLTGWACGLDFKYKADGFLLSLPGSRAAIVGGRFATVPLAWAAGFATMLLMWALRSAFGPFLDASALPGIAVVSLAATLATNAIYLAAYYAVGFQYARWANVVFFGSLFALGSIMGEFPTGAAGPGSARAGVPGALDRIVGGRGEPGLYVAVLVAGLAIFAVACSIAIASYRKKEA